MQPLFLGDDHTESRGLNVTTNRATFICKHHIMETKEAMEAIYALGGCLLLSGGVAVWVAVSYFVPVLWKRIRRLDRLLEFEEKHTTYHE